MFGCVVVESDDFAEKTTAANVSSHMTLTLAGTKKYITYNLNKQLRAISVLEESELLANSAKAQRFATNTIAGTMLFGAGILPALAVLFIGQHLPEKTKSEYLIFVEFTDGKSAILKANQKHYNKLKKYL